MAEPVAVNPDTGQRLVYRGGKWVPLGGEGVMADTKADQESLTKIRDAARKAEYVAGKADEFGRLNERTGTGGIMGVNLPFGLGGASDVAKLFMPNVGTMDSITSQVTPQFREPGSGATSDYDAKMFRQAFPNVDNLGSTNGAIIKRLRAEATEKAAYAEFADQWFAKHGTLLGADAAWRKRKAVPRAAAATAPGVPAAKPAAPPPKKPVTAGSGWKVVS